MSSEAGRRKYRNPPIQEAVCEFYFEPSQEWDLTIPGKVHERLKTSYPGKPKQQRLVQTQLSPEAGRISVSESAIRVQLVDHENRHLITLGPDQVSVHIFRPYSTWESFREKIFEALKAYREVAQPEGVSKIGLRYINKIDLPETEVALSEYFTTPPVTPDEFPDPMTRLLHRTEGYYDAHTRLVYNFSSLVDNDELASHFLLDLDLQWGGDTLHEEDEIKAVLEDLRNKEREAFEALITDSAREVFDAAAS